MPSMRTLSTGYQRPHPRIITRSCPFHRLTATTCPQGQLTCVVPWKACSTSAALIWRTLVDCICDSFPDAPRSPTPHRGRLLRSGVEWGEDKEPLIWRRWAEEGEEIDQDVSGEFDSTRRMVDGLSRIITHDERVRPQRLGAVRTGFVEASHSRQQAVGIVDDEDDGLPLFRVSYRYRSEKISERSIPILLDALDHSEGGFSAITYPPREQV
jgi:hypothetical protein